MKKLGPWKLKEVIVHHDRDCQIWKASRRSNGTHEIAIKLKGLDEMTDEMQFMVRCAVNSALQKLPVFDVPFKNASERFGIVHVDGEDKGWIAMRKFEYTLKSAPLELVEKHWKSILRQMVNQLADIHDVGYVHCDMKMDNILLDINEKSVTVGIADFGLVTPTEVRLNKKDSQSDTIYYMLISGAYPDKPFGCRADLEGAGIALGTKLKGEYYVLPNSWREAVEMRQNIPATLDPRVHPYFEILENMDWSDTTYPLTLFAKITRMLV